MVEAVSHSDGQGRLVLALAKGAMRVAATQDGKVMLRANDRSLTISMAALSALVRRDLLVRKGAEISLSTAGRACARRLLAGGDAFQEQHRELETIEIELPQGRATATVNRAESPLSQLMRRRNRDGEAFLTGHEFRAGERLRADYARGQIMPRLGANWDAAIATGRRASPSTDLSDGALAARQRVERAIDAVGPELAGVLIDVCCFLKGLEQVESERSWPVRSAKVVLKTALGSLARHYEPERARPGRIVSWGTSDYRPKLADQGFG